ncbi:MAG TPA: hypothetical protein VFM94_05225 [Solirubrobacterales bacterium]|nr:hypothetical protein [Solirubrobacterales bacterium]
MEAMRESWTDDRLDDLNGKVDAQHLEMRTEFRAIRGEMKDEFRAVRGEMKEEFRAVRGEIGAGFDRIDGRFDALQRTLLQIAGGTIATLIAGFAGIIATQL